MGFSVAPTAVFIETNLGTRLAVSASTDITAEDFKKEVERAHLNCFPEFGNIQVKAVMVNHKSCCYHLSKSLPLKYAFLGSEAPWFLQTCVDPLNVPDQVGSLNYHDTKAQNINSAANVITASGELGGSTMSSNEKIMKCKRKRVRVQRWSYLNASLLKISALSYFLRKMKRNNVKRKRKTGHQRRERTQHSLIEKEMLCRLATGAETNRSKKSDTDVVEEAISETISEPASVSGILKKYFSDYDEVASSPEFPFTTAVRYRHHKWLRRSTEGKYSNMHSGIMSPETGHKPPRVSQDVWRLEQPRPEALIEKHKTPNVGKCLLLASNGLGLGITPCNRNSILSPSPYNDGESLFHKTTAPVQNSVFEMPDQGMQSSIFDQPAPQHALMLTV